MSHLHHGNEAVARTFGVSQGSRSLQIRIPSTIARALLMLHTGDCFTTLSRSTKEVLAYLVLLADLTDACQPVFAFKRTIAAKTGLSESTVYRSIGELANDNIIIREPQRRKERNGRLSGAQLRLSPSFCKELGLVVGPNAQTQEKSYQSTPELTTPVPSVNRAGEGASDNLWPSVKMTDGQCITGFKALQSLQKHSPGTSPRTVIDKPATVRTKVPEELFWLIEEKNLTQPQVFLLMREFGQRQQRLSDAVEVTRKRIEQLGNREVFRYLRALAKAPTDFSWIRKQREQSLRAVQRDNHLREVSTERLNRMNGNFLVSTNGESVHQIDATTQTAEVWWREEGTGRIRNGQAPINAAYVEALAAGRLKPIDREKAEALISSWTTASAGSRRIH